MTIVKMKENLELGIKVIWKTNSKKNSTIYRSHLSWEKLDPKQKKEWNVEMESHYYTNCDNEAEEVFNLMYQGMDRILIDRKIYVLSAFHKFNSFNFIDNKGKLFNFTSDSIE